MLNDVINANGNKFSANESAKKTLKPMISKEDT